MNERALPGTTVGTRSFAAAWELLGDARPTGWSVRGPEFVWRTERWQMVASGPRADGTPLELTVGAETDLDCLIGLAWALRNLV